jgi:calcineurin-like phosphoesterase family protein
VHNIWFTADFHLGHKNIIRYCNRPFQTVEEMNQEILERLNSRAKANDILYFLGDFCIGPRTWAAEFRQKIRCKKIFALAGNHDKETRKLTQEFTWLNDLAEVSLNGQRIVLCHYALRVWNQSSRGAWHLYGTPTASFRPPTLHFRWMLVWIHTIFALGTSTKSKIE